jgi:hypothetical protein
MPDFRECARTPHKYGTGSGSDPVRYAILKLEFSAEHNKPSLRAEPSDQVATAPCSVLNPAEVAILY